MSISAREDHSTEQLMSKSKQATQKWEFTLKTQIVIHDSHKHTTTQGLQKQTHKIHANMQEYKTKIHMTHISKKNTQTHKTHIKHQTNMWSQKITKGWTQQCRRHTNITKHENTHKKTKHDGPKAQDKMRMGLWPDTKQREN